MYIGMYVFEIVCHFGIGIMICACFVVSVMILYLVGFLKISGPQMGGKELLHRIGVPLVDSQRLLHFSILVHQVDHWVCTSNVLDFEVWESRRFLAFDKSLNLGICTQSSSADFEAGEVVLFGHLVHLVLDAARLAAAP